MKRLLTTVFISIILSTSIAAQSTTDVLINADQLYNTRDVNTHFQQCIDLLNKHLLTTTAPNLKYELLWRLARTGSQVPYYIDGTDAELLTQIEASIAAGDQALILQPNSIVPLYWKSIAIGRHAEIKGILKSLKSVKPIRNNMNIIIKADPTFHRAYFVLSRLHRKAPKFISIGNPKKSLDYITTALQYDPTESIYLLEKARVLKKLGKKDQAAAVVTTLLALPENDPKYFADQVRRDKLAGLELGVIANK